MKKLHALAFYAMVAPALTLGSGALLAQESSSSSASGESQATERDYESGKSSDTKLQFGQKEPGHSGMKGENYMSAVPAQGMQATDLIGADVKTTGGDEVGAISDLIIDQDGRVVAIVVGVGGFLGMGEKNVAISWERVTKSGTADDRELRINQTREELKSAPEYKVQN
ncbi:Sporulation protein YlmC, PRC-barrel domain family [Marinobacter gudaonensis]|uniref:Sporulation protein YlmC, PRC-barrel domain family n=1 Tax=Marinobacter gudaonensis TaxID=375760 RepID=A0A1I6GAE0_9GAMM|nr:PRC-barrel domain-containing protein [Marinobacter gudaonensis]SFR39047.1 Sporulation protein YlmC, PRC-barrel domain family [Marinobacter gudaonensis]